MTCGDKVVPIRRANKIICENDAPQHDHSRMSRVDPRERQLERHDNRYVAVVILWLAILFMLATCSYTLHSARAMDHGWDKNDPFVQWVESLKRPDSGYQWSCCGKGDLYPIKIEQDAVGDDGDAMGTAIITDGSAVHYPDGITREPLPNGAVFHFPKSKVNEKQGNPTKTAYAFLSAANGNIVAIWCVIPLPGAV